MPRSSFASVSIDVDTGTQPRRVEPDSDTPFRILLLGDFSGRASHEDPATDRLRPCLIDRDNLDEIVARLHPTLEFGSGGQRFVLQFQELEDFHPDPIYRQDVFERVRAVRHLLAPQPPAAAPATRTPAPPDLSAFTSTAGLLDSVLEATESQPVRQRDALRDFVERAVAPHTAPREDPRVTAKTAEISAEAGQVMRALLHHPGFQALEAVWRSVDWLFRGLETGTQLKIYLLDISKAGLAGKMGQLRRLLVDDAAGTAGEEPWGLVAGNFTFSRSTADIRLLSELAGVMRAAGTVFLAEADPNEADSPEAESLWQGLRNSPAAASVGLLLPRFLLRLPYGAKTDSVESFPFEEMPGTPDHHNYLWGNPAFACTYLLGQSFVSDGWDMRPGTHAEITGLPLHVYEAEGEQQLKPCAEMLMTEADADWIMEQGYMPLASIKNRDAVRLIRFQSIANPLAPLAGAWT